MLGNHDHHDDRPEEIAAILRDAGVRVLEGEATVLECAGVRLGVAGTKGFGGGFVGSSAGEFGEPEMKEFVRPPAAAPTRWRVGAEGAAGRAATYGSR